MLFRRARYEVKENNYIFKQKKLLINKNDKIFFDKYFCFGNYEKIYIEKQNFCQKVFFYRKSKIVKL